jgi:hypothetical protein
MDTKKLIAKLMKRMYLSIIRSSLASFLLLSNCWFAVAQITGTTEAFVKPGRITFATNHGNIVVTLPSTLYRGEIISGTLAIEPKGPNEKQQLKNTEILNSFMICLPEKDFLISQFKVSCELPATEKINVGLFDKKGTLIKTEIIDTAEPQTFVEKTGYSFQPYLIAGLPAKITGNFDGYFFNSYVYVNGEEAKLLAESGHELIFEAPSEISGPQTIDFSENDVSKEFQINVLDLKLEAGQWELAKGETTTIKVQLAGFQGLQSPVEFYIKNENPLNIVLEGGNDHKVTIEPGSVGASGIFSTSVQASAIQKGKLSIFVSFNPPAVDDGNETPDVPVSGK